MDLARIRSSVVADVAVPASAGDRTQKINVLYSGNADFARVQFAAEAPQLHLVIDAGARSGAASDTGANGGPALDVAFIDCGSPGVNAASLVEQLRERQPGLPIVIALDPSVDDAARLALDLQAEDYTVKSPGWLGRLQVRLAMVVARQRRARQLEAVRAIEERLRSIVESSPVCLARVDRDGTILAINDAARALIGVTQPADVLRKSIVTFVTPDDQDAARRFIDLACADQAGSVEFSLTTAPSVVRRVEASAIKLPSAANVEPTAALVLREAGSAAAPPDQSVVDAAVAEATGDLAAQAAELAFRNEEIQRELAELQERCRQLTEDRDRALAHAARAGASETALAEKLRHLELDAVRGQGERDELQHVVDQHRSTHAAELASTASARDDLLRALEAAVAARRLLETERDSLQTASEERRLRYEAEIAGALFARADLEGRLRSAEAGINRAAEEARAAAAAQLTELEARRHQLETERDALLERVETRGQEHQAEIAALAAAHTEARQKVADLEGQLRAAEAAEKRKADETVAAMKDRLTELEAGRRQLETERDALREAVETSGHEHRAAVAALAVARADAQMRVADFQEQLRSAAAGAKRAAEEAVAGAADQRRALEARWQQLEAERESLRKAADDRDREHQATLAALAAAHAEGQGRIAALEEQLRSAEAAARRAADEAVASTADRLQQLEARCRQLDGERDALREMEDTLACQHRAEIADVIAGRAVVERKVAELEARARVALEAQDLSARQLAQWQSGSQQFDGERTKLEARVEELMRALTRAVTERDGLRVTLTEVHERHAKALADEISNRRVVERRVERAGSRLAQALEAARAEFAQLTAGPDDSADPEAPPWI
jgi:PAS domain S-box-containing protein